MNKSKRRIRLALIELLADSTFEELRIHQLITKADVSRSTFYNYYENKYVLLEEIETELTEGFLKLMRQHGKNSFLHLDSDKLTSSRVLLEYVQEHQLVLSALLPEQSLTHFDRRFKQKIQQTYHELNLTPQTSAESYAFATYREKVIANAYVTLFTAWLEHERMPPINEMAEFLARLW